MFTFDEINNSIITKDGVIYPINNREFIHDGIEYVIYHHTTTLVKHKLNDINNIETKYFGIPLIIRKDKALEHIQDFASIAKNQLEIAGYEPGSLEATLNKIKKQMMIRLDEGALSLPSDFKQLITFLFEYMENFNFQDICKNLNASKLVKLTITEYGNETPYGKILSDFSKYMSHHNTFNDSIINNRGFTIYVDVLFMIVTINMLMTSEVALIAGELSSVNSIEDMLLHGLIEMMISIIIMRVDYEMFIMGRNKIATEIVKKYYRQYQILRNPDINIVMANLQNNEKFLKDIEGEGIQLYPFIMYYNKSNKLRITQCYNMCKEANQNNKSLQKNIRWVSSEQFYNMLLEFSNKHIHNYMRYDMNSFTDMINQLLKVDNNVYTDDSVEMCE